MSPKSKQKLDKTKPFAQSRAKQQPHPNKLDKKKATLDVTVQNKEGKIVLGTSRQGQNWSPHPSMKVPVFRTKNLSLRHPGTPTNKSPTQTLEWKFWTDCSFCLITHFGVIPQVIGQSSQPQIQHWITE